MYNKVFKKTFFISAAILTVAFLAIAYGVFSNYMHKDSQMLQDKITNVAVDLAKDFEEADSAETSIAVMDKVMNLNELDLLYVSVELQNGTTYGDVYDGEITDKRDFFGSVYMAHDTKTFNSEYFEGEGKVTCVFINTYYNVFAQAPFGLVIAIVLIVGAAFSMAIIPANIRAKSITEKNSKKRK